MNKSNATFHAFKETGKWYTTERGYLSQAVFDVFDTTRRRAQVLIDNDGKYPGLSGAGSEFIFVIIGDDDAPGFPLMLWTE